MDLDDRIGLLGRKRHRKEHLRPDDRRRSGDDGRPRPSRPSDQGRLVPPASDRGDGPHRHPARHHPPRPARSVGSPAPLPPRPVRHDGGEGRHHGRQPVGRRARPPAAQHGRHGAAAPAHPRRADQPPRYRQPARPDHGDQRLQRRGDPDHPRSLPDGDGRRPAVARHRRLGLALRRRHGRLRKVRPRPRAETPTR